MSDPSYLTLADSGALAERAKELTAELRSCELCPRRCAADRADLTVESPFDLWADILAGKTAVHDAFSRNQCKAAGNLALLKVFGP